MKTTTATVELTQEQVRYIYDLLAEKLKKHLNGTRTRAKKRGERNGSTASCG